jgi:hypothetical protein
VSFSRWLRATSEHHLMVAAQEKIAAKYRVAPPPPPRGTEIFWRRVYVPAYRAVPWPVRRSLIQLMPGSHHMSWAKSPRPRGPAI